MRPAYLIQIFVYFPAGSCADNPLILQAFASSQFASSFGYGYLVKLDSNKEYCRNGYKVDADEYFTIDFLFRHKICAVATIGRDGFFVDEYRISYGVKHDVWNDSSLFGSPYVSRYVFLKHNHVRVVVKGTRGRLLTGRLRFLKCKNMSNHAQLHPNPSVNIKLNSEFEFSVVFKTYRLQSVSPVPHSYISSTSSTRALH